MLNTLLKKGYNGMVSRMKESELKYNNKLL
jgi:hypothetical protein